MRERRSSIATKCGIRFPGDPNPDSPAPLRLLRRAHPPVLRAVAQAARRRDDRPVPTPPPRPADGPAGGGRGVREAASSRARCASSASATSARRFVAALQTACPLPLIVNQVEIHLGRLDCFYDGTLDQCLAEKMTPLAWSPLGGGVLGDRRQPPADRPTRAKTCCRRLLEAWTKSRPALRREPHRDRARVAAEAPEPDHPDRRLDQPRPHPRGGAGRRDRLEPAKTGTACWSPPEAKNCRDRRPCTARVLLPNVLVRKTKGATHGGSRQQLQRRDVERAA